MPDQLTPKEKSWLQVPEIHCRARLRDYRSFNALISRHPILYLTQGLAIGLAITLLFPPLAQSSG
jgi:hypothetical protein